MKSILFLTLTLSTLQVFAEEKTQSNLEKKGKKTTHPAREQYKNFGDFFVDPNSSGLDGVTETGDY